MVICLELLVAYQFEFLQLELLFLNCWELLEGSFVLLHCLVSLVNTCNSNSVPGFLFPLTKFYNTPLSHFLEKSRYFLVRRVRNVKRNRRRWFDILTEKCCDWNGELLFSKFKELYCVVESLLKMLIFCLFLLL